ncbi:superoxide dismutase family protein [Gordonia sp. HY285]|uniref:Superoxide dismutase family protein n=1 Tax=Gordonia liuliyuniae TaxID=2911517 RepID=A0ABS9IST8_9ACTN|nr:superoxide dismutase family protein [Gordonia liuliyuniae]MCF8588629.1 superoxide dismutase family protein [Gordonia liuliyuniae]MCF8609490.1 superoxide dismutase family protein [Gordonia liuliyuniae]
MFARNHSGAATGISTTRVLAVIAAAGVAGAALAGCTPDQYPTDEKGTTPSVITGDQAQPGDEISAGTTSGGAEELTVTLRNTEGTSVGFATFSAEGDAVSVNLRVTGMDAGSHGVHIHSGTKCEASTGFASAGDHLQVDGHTGKPESGDLTSVTVLENGTGTVTSATDAFELEQIRGRALIVHEVGDTDGSHRLACGVIAE